MTVRWKIALGLAPLAGLPVLLAFVAGWGGSAPPRRRPPRRSLWP